MRIILISVLLAGVAATLLAGCGDDGGSGSGGKLEVVASFYPLAEAVRQVGGDRVEVTNLTPPGVEPHDLELTSDDIDAIDRADLVVDMGHGFQAAVEKAAGRRHGPTLAVLDGVPTHGGDAHVWLDPQRMATIVRLVAGALGKVDATSATTFTGNAGFYIQKLTTLSRELGVGLRDCQRHTIVTSHEAFGYLAESYGLTQTAVAGLDPEQEPNPARMAELLDLVKKDGVTTIFTEKLVSPKVARSVARQAHVKVAVMNPLEGLTHEEENGGADYLSVMRENLRILQQALACT
ncbi:MAG: zinc ABC transporter substrate-binding protein [Acidobacteria bacterium]|nr:zinc ABC transporter substrate-binding protein [Acidobacteriota bacterium]